VKRWEYREVHLVEGTLGRHGWTVHLNGPESLAARQEDLLASAGADGWELVTVLSEASRRGRSYVFKREVSA
jgi:hypothetical protein